MGEERRRKTREHSAPQRWKRKMREDHDRFLPSALLGATELTHLHVPSGVAAVAALLEPHKAVHPLSSALVPLAILRRAVVSGLIGRHALHPALADGRVAAAHSPRRELLRASHRRRRLGIRQALRIRRHMPNLEGELYRALREQRGIWERREGAAISDANAA